MADFEVKENINLGGNQIKNGGFEVVASLPTAPNNFIGRQVTYQGRIYIWDGSVWKCDSDTLGGKPYTDFYGNFESSVLPILNQQRTNLGNPSVFETSVIDAQFSNQIQFFDINYTNFERSNDGINFNTASDITDTQKKKLFAGTSQANLPIIEIPRGTYLRITLESISYRYLNMLYLYYENRGGVSQIKIEKYSLYSETWVDVIDYQSFGSYPAHSVVRHNSIPFRNYNSTSHYSKVRLTIKTSEDTTGTALTHRLFYIEWYGGYPAGRRTIYYNDENKNAFFPASVQSNETINFDTNNIEPTQSGTTTKTSTWLWQYLTQSVNFIWLKLKDLFPTTQATTHNYIPKIDNANKKLVKSNIQDDGSRVQIDSPLRVNNNIYYDVAFLKGGGTGIIKIKTPWTEVSDTNNTMSIIEIDIRDHSSEKAAKLTIYFYVYNSIGNFYRTWATLIGDLPSKVIKTCYDPTNKCILIGEPTTVWSNLVINVSKVINGFNRTLDDSVGWDISYITDTSSYTGIISIKHINKGLDADLLDGKHASDFATSTHTHDGAYSTTDTKNTAGATNTSSKIYLVGSTEQTANPQTYTHDTVYVDVDGNLYSGNSKTITNSDLETNQLYPPTLNPVWTILKSNNSSSGIVVTTSAITLEYGYKPSATVQAKWTQPSGYSTPERSDGLCGIYTIPNQLAINTNTSPAANIPYATYFDPVYPTVPSKSVTVWTIYANKKGITVSGNKLIMPVGEVSVNALLSVIYQLPIYYGVVTNNSLTEIIIKALPSSMKDCAISSKTFSPNINASDLQYWVYAYPSAWGVLSNLSNADGDWTAAFTTGLINIVSSNTLLTTEYRYYITVNKGAFKNKILNFS